MAMAVECIVAIYHAVFCIAYIIFGLGKCSQLIAAVLTGNNYYDTVYERKIDRIFNGVQNIS